jgi:hypothetical protein
MTERKKTGKKATPEGAAEVSEEALDQASGGAGYIKMPTDKVMKPGLDQNLVGGLNPTDQFGPKL